MAKRDATRGLACRKNRDKSMEAVQRTELTIYELKQSGAIDELQERLHQVTGLAFLTVDYRGLPVSEMTGFTDYCCFRRKYDYYAKNCVLSNAFGGAAAAINNKPYIYKCHAGLIHIAVPIVIRGQFLGSLLCGQIKCSDVPKLDDFGERLRDSVDWTKEEELCKKFNDIEEITFKQVEQISELVFLYVKMMCQKETYRLEKTDCEISASQIMEENAKTKEKEQHMEEMILNRNQEQIHSQFVLTILNSAAGLACVEDAEQTEEMIHLLIKMIQYQMKKEDSMVSLKEELTHVERYLKIQKLRFEEKINYDIVKDIHLEEQMVIPHILLPFVENAMLHGILARRGEGRIRISCYRENRDCIISIEDEGTEQKMGQNGEGIFCGHSEHSRISQDIYVVRQRLMNKYGVNYDIQLSSGKSEGTMVNIRIPQSVERVRYYV